MAGLAYGRALLKISGEAFAGRGPGGSGIDFGVIERLADELVAVHQLGVELGLVVGGGNILRGTTASQQGMDRVSADYMGMLATVINALALQDTLEKKGVNTRVMTAIRMEELAEPYIRRRAVRHLEKKRMVIFAGTAHCHPAAVPGRILRRGMKPVLSVQPVLDGGGRVAEALADPESDVLFVMTGAKKDP